MIIDIADDALPGIVKSLSEAVSLLLKDQQVFPKTAMLQNKELLAWKRRHTETYEKTCKRIPSSASSFMQRTSK